VSEMKILNDENMSTDGKVPITDDYGLVMRYPSIINVQEVMAKVPDGNALQFSFELAKQCLVGIYKGKEYITVQNASESDLNTVFDDLQDSQYKKVEAFFDTMPQIAFNVKFTCAKCAHDNALVIEGTENFFG